MTTLAPYTTPGTYEYQVLDLLHDPNANKWSTTQVDQYVNEARRQLVMDTSCLRSYQYTYCTQSQESYVFGAVGGATILTAGNNYTAPSVTFFGGTGGSGVAATVTASGGAVNSISFSSFGSGYITAPSALINDATGSGATLAVGVINVNTYDVLGVNLIWGNARYALQWLPFRTFSAYYRPYSGSSGYQRQPAAWAVYGQNSIILGPIPDQTYPIELDTVILPTPFAVGDTTTVDPIPAMSQDPIKFYAAYLAKNNAQSYGEAEKFLEQYNRRLKEVTSACASRCGVCRRQCPLRHLVSRSRRGIPPAPNGSHPGR